MIIIHRLVHGQERHQYNIMSKINIMRQYFQYYMHENKDPSDFYKRFTSIRTAMHESGIKMVWPSTREASRQQLYPQIKMADLNQWQHHKITNHADEAFHAVMIVAKSNNKKYKGLITQLSNDWVMGQDHYPRTEATSIRMQRLYISLYVSTKQQQHNEESDDQSDQSNTNEQSVEPPKQTPKTTGVIFAQQGDDTNQFYCGACKKKRDYNYLDCVILQRANTKMATTNAQIATQPDTNDNQSIARTGNLQQNQLHQQHLQQHIVPQQNQLHQQYMQQHIVPQQNQTHQQHLQQHIAHHKNDAYNNTPAMGQQFLMNTTTNYNTDDDDDNDN